MHRNISEHIDPLLMPHYCNDLTGMTFGQALHESKFNLLLAEKLNCILPHPNGMINFLATQHKLSLEISDSLLKEALDKYNEVY